MGYTFTVMSIFIIFTTLYLLYVRICPYHYQYIIPMITYITCIHSIYHGHSLSLQLLCYVNSYPLFLAHNDQSTFCHISLTSSFLLTHTDELTDGNWDRQGQNQPYCHTDNIQFDAKTNTGQYKLVYRDNAGLIQILSQKCKQTDQPVDIYIRDTHIVILDI